MSFQASSSSWRAVSALLLAVAVIQCAATARESWPHVAHSQGIEAPTSSPERMTRATIHDTIDDHDRVQYTSSTVTDTWDVLAEADEHPDDPLAILTIYRNNKVEETDHPEGWNREHVWPISYGGDRRDERCNYQYSDLHALFASDPSYNGSRGNEYFDGCLTGCTEYEAEGRPGEPNRSDTDAWEVWDGRKGDAARAIFYMDVRYEGGVHGDTDCDEPDLVVTSHTSVIQTTGGRATRAYMGSFRTLLRWHADDPVDELDEHRNGVIEDYQGNRNPFIDHPEWVCEVWDCDGTVYLPWAGADEPPRPTATQVPVTATPAPTVIPIPIPSRTPTAVIIIPTKEPTAVVQIREMECFERDEWVRLHNYGLAAAELKGWTLLSVVGSQEFEFPAYRLESGQSVYVHSGPDATETGGEHIRWTKAYRWNNDGDEAELMAPGGLVVDREDCG